MRKTRVKITSSISVLFILLLSLDLQAQAITMAPVGTWLRQLGDLIKNSSSEFEKKSNLNIDLPGGKIVSDQLTLKARYHVADLQSELKQFKLALSIDNAEVIAKNVQIQVLINQDLGFGSATLNLNATCSAIAVHLKTPQILNAYLNKNFQVEKIVGNISNNDLKTELVGCTEIAGLDQMIQDKVINYIQNQLVSQQLHQVLSEQIDIQLNEKINKLIKNYLGDAILTSPAAHIRIDEDFRLWTYFGENAENQFSKEEINSISENTKKSVLVKKLFLEKIILSYLDKQLAATPISSQRMTDLQKLTCSRWTQFFIWPSLMALPKCFDMHLISRVKSLKLLDPRTMKFTVKIQTWVQAPAQQQQIAYFISNVEVSLISMSAEINDFRGKQNPEFLNWAGYSSRMSSKPLRAALQQFLSNKVIQIKNNKDPDTNLVLSWLKFEKIKSLTEDSLSFQLKN